MGFLKGVALKVQEVFQYVPGTMPVWLVVLIGIGIVFIGLICIIILCSAVGLVMQWADRKSSVEEIPDRPELIAAISAAIAEDAGEDVRKIRIVSIRKA